MALFKSYCSLGFLVFLLAGPMVLAADAGGTSEAQNPAPSRLGMSLTSYHYEFRGKKAADGDIYAFGDLSLSMQLLVATYQLSPGWTLVGATSYNSNFAETYFGGLLYRDRTSGIADTRLMAVHPAWIDGGQMLLVEGGLSVPTGSISKRNQNDPTGTFNYPFNMQLGSGTWDPVVAATYLNTNGNFTHGARAQAVLRVMDNSNDYRLGNDYLANVWTDYRVSSYFTPGAKFNYRNRRGVTGVDPRLGRNLYDEYYYHPQINWDLSLVAKSAIPLYGKLAAVLNLEAGVPLVQGLINLDNVVVDTAFYASAGIQLAM